jgi:hypothetical protein
MLNLLRKSFSKESIGKRKLKSTHYACITSGFIFLSPPKSLNNKRSRLSFVQLSVLKGFKKLTGTRKASQIRVIFYNGENSSKGWSELIN